MAFRNQIIAGELLLRSGIKSDGYAPGISGWRVGKDGNAEFNNVDLRGQLRGRDYFLGDLTGPFEGGGTATWRGLHLRAQGFIENNDSTPNFTGLHFRDDSLPMDDGNTLGHPRLTARAAPVPGTDTGLGFLDGPNYGLVGNLWVGLRRLYWWGAWQWQISGAESVWLSSKDLTGQGGPAVIPRAWGMELQRGGAWLIGGWQFVWNMGAGAAVTARFEHLPYFGFDFDFSQFAKMWPYTYVGEYSPLEYFNRRVDSNAAAAGAWTRCEMYAVHLGDPG